MWYVNLENADERYTKLKFYINYVICKYEDAEKTEIKFKSFILTMWYVNFSLDRIFYTTQKSFILTMWYVNYRWNNRRHI